MRPDDSADLPGAAGASEPLLALTLWQPWAWCVARGLKRVENRDWPPPASLVGRRFAIHAGRHYDAPGAASLAGRRAALGLGAGEPPEEDRLARGAIVAVATLAGAVKVAPAAAGGFAAARCVGELPPDRVRAVERDAWTQGSWAWLLEDVVEIEPISCPGNRKLWTVPEPLASRVREEERRRSRSR